ncbi:hypothetical protein A8709_25990 [Paenibacillus pectinilyticus]|uniref:Uncharacterized protein n=1 Tax=Paenibacillus pectinilyticus TaxID=512399 RepID=A0A1C1A178_9BACL|nr:hypothetical protein [Paenibacillus pectinilyticus]OCT14282.1 hypothetical protein A8709_25990 [Paenibacillus pectinilyticus]
MRRFLRAENGAVSVYLILIIVPIFLFQAVLIDFARIKVAEKETESAVQAAARSVMSSFDTDLQKRGLYGMGLSQEASEQLFGDVFIRNLSSSVSAKGFHFIDTHSLEDSTRVTPVYSLANHVIFERQLTQDMKIKAPIEYTLEIVDKFQKSGVKEPFQLGSQFAKEAAEVEKLIKQREDALDEAWHSTEAMNAKLTSYHTYYRTRIAALNELADRIGIHTVDGIRDDMTATNEHLQSLASSISDMELSIASLSKAGAESVESIKSLVAAKSSLEQQASTLTHKLSELQALLQNVLDYTALTVRTKLELAANASEIARLQQIIEPAIRLAKQKNDDIRTKLLGISDSSSTGSLGGAKDVFQHVSLIRDDYFYQYQTSIASITALFSAFQASVESVNLYTTEHTAQINQRNEAYWNEMNSFYAKQSSLEKVRMNANSATEANKQAQTNTIQAILEKAKQAIGGCDISASPSGDEALYSKLQGDSDQTAAIKEQGYYQKYRQANAQDATIGNDVAYELDKAESTSLRAMDILGSISHMAEMLRTELYVNEYAFTKFNYRTYGLEKTPTGEPKLSNELIDPGTHVLANQEVEYLLYGFSSCAANITSAYAEMFSLRLAIRTLEALLDPEKELLNVGSPLLVLLVAAAQGAAKAFGDMNALVKGEAVELSSKLSVTAFKLTYKDYLRLFLMLHSNNTKLMARMQGLIELETGKDLLQETTYMQANAASEIRLWFIPKMIRLLEGSGLLGCKVVGTQCQFNRSAVVSY